MTDYERDAAIIENEKALADLVRMQQELKRMRERDLQDMADLYEQVKAAQQKRDEELNWLLEVASNRVCSMDSRLRDCREMEQYQQLAADRAAMVLLAKVVQGVRS